MSDPKLQRADGCSVFFSLILGLVFVFAYFLFQIFFDDVEKTELNSYTVDERRKNVDAFQLESKQFENSVDQFHANKNSNLESSMRKTIEMYSIDRQQNKIQK
ncbi:MAG: hypothetical protein P8P49_08760 [Opitutales bacterium]|nr:hypothetical protein [Opitutales bacterium]